MLIDEIIRAKDTDTSVLQKEFANEHLIVSDAEKITFEQVSFIKCQISGSIFEGAEFFDVTFDQCDLSNCNFKNAYFKNCRFSNCKMDGSTFGSASFKSVKMEGSTFLYCNFVATLWENTETVDSDLKQSFMSEVRFKKPVFRNVNLESVDFFKTKLKGIDLSGCNIVNIMVSDTYTELAGVKVNIYQAADLAKLLKIQIV